MEIELKYKIKGKAILDEIFADKDLLEMTEESTMEELSMQAVYYDTKDRALSNNGVAMRMRKEGDRAIATLKYSETPQSMPGLYQRQEINIPITEERLFTNPKPDIFIESEEGKRLLEVVKGEPLFPLLKMDFIRKKLRLDDGDVICEIALDYGEILANNKVAPICELEVELYSGKKEGLIKIGGKLAEKYGLEPEQKSKLARGLDLYM
jgi:inorganic triphosphatase YgiF